MSVGKACPCGAPGTYHKRLAFAEHIKGVHGATGPRALFLAARIIEGIPLTPDQLATFGLVANGGPQRRVERAVTTAPEAVGNPGSQNGKTPSSAPACGLCRRSSVGKCRRHGGGSSTSDYMRAYGQRPDVKEKKRAYGQRPDVKEQRRATERRRAQSPEALERRARRLLERAAALKGADDGHPPHEKV